MGSGLFDLPSLMTVFSQPQAALRFTITSAPRFWAVHTRKVSESAHLGRAARTRRSASAGSSQSAKPVGPQEFWPMPVTP